jgi:hypothetical protein
MTRNTGIFLLAFSMLTLSAQGGQFRRATYHLAGQRPYRVVAAKLTNSGNVDLAVADWVSDQLVVLLGNGDGTFQKPLRFSVPGPISLAAADFNEDGNLDLAVVEDVGTGDGTIAIFLGDGKGGFKLSGSYVLGPVSVSVAVADFNGDGHLDVAVTNKGFNTPGSVMTFFGDGHGKLQGRTTYKLSGGPFGIAAGDLNGDQHPDLAVTQGDHGTVAVLINDGSGKFKKAVTYSAGGGGVEDVKIANLRHDGRNDLVIANGSLSAVGVLLNKGNGTFGAVTLYPVCQNYCQAAEAVVIDDFNLDGKLDVAVAGHIGDSSLYYGKGDGTFKPAVRIHNSIGNFQNSGPSIAAGDFITGNQAPDLAIPIELNGKVAIMINTQ